MCHQYVGHNSRSIALESPDAFTQYAKQRVRLERGQPISKVLNRPYSPIPNATGLVGLDFSHGNYGWIEDAIVYVHNLHSNTTQSFCTENRDTFTALRISELCLIFDICWLMLQVQILSCLEHPNQRFGVFPVAIVKLEILRCSRCECRHGIQWHNSQRTRQYYTLAA